MSAHIKKIDESFVQLLTDELGCLQDIKDRLSFKIENAKYHPLVKQRRWDGIIRLVHQNNSFYTGLIPIVENILTRNNIEYTIDDTIVPRKVEVTKEEVNQFVDSLPITNGKTPITPYGYQRTALVHAVRNPRVTLLSSVSSGKSLIMYLYIRWLLQYEPARTVLLIVPSVQLVYQLKKDFIDYSSQDDTFNPDDYVQIMHDDSEKIIQKNIVIVNVQAIQKQPKAWFAPFTVVIHDEVHRAKAKTFKRCLEFCVNASRRVGLTGTFDGVEVNELTIQGLIGKTREIIDTRELINKDLATELEIRMLILRYPSSFIPRLKRGNYAQEIDFIAGVPERREIIYRILDKTKGNTLIIFSLVEKHLEPMMQEYIQRGKAGKNVFVVDGDVPMETREEIRNILETTNNNVVFCSYGTFSTGINIRNIHNLVMAMGSKSRVRVKQTLGRLIRKHSSKNKAIVFDIVDDLRAGLNWSNACYNHGTIRKKLYKEDGFEIKYKRLELR